MRLKYRCPGCRTTSNLHDPGCEFEGTERVRIENAYTDLLAALSAREYPDEDALREAVPGRWSNIHAAVLSRLRSDGRVVEGEHAPVAAAEESNDKRQRDGNLRLLSAEAYRNHVSHPTFEPLQTIYEKGSVPGAHDNSVFSLIAFYEMVGLSWEETRENTVEWLRTSGTWDRGGFEERSPAELVEGKRHVYEQGYGWKEKARAAKAVIDRHMQ